MIKSINTKLSRTLLLLISFAMLFFITACGGSKDDVTGGTGGTSTGSSISISSTVTSLAAGESSIITATVIDGAGVPVQGKTVTFTLLNNNSGATITTLNGGHTDAKGQAIATYTAGANSPTTSIQDTIQASASGATAATTITRISSSSAATGFRMTLTADSTSLAAGQSTIVKATVTDGSGSPAGGQAVTFTLLNNNSGATLTILSLGVTDNSGQALAIYKAGANSPTTSVQDTIQASVTGAVGVIMITRLSSSATSTGLIMTLTADATSLSAGNSTIIKAMVTDGSGKSASGQTVSFALFSNLSGATLVPLNGGVTDASGKAIATYTAGANSPTASVQDIIQASVAGTIGAIIITRMPSSATASGVVIKVTATPSSLHANAISVVVAQVNNADGTAAPGLPVTFGIAPNNSSAPALSVVNGTTDANGQAIAIYTAGNGNPSLSEDDVVTATVTGAAAAAVITRLPSVGTGNRLTHLYLCSDSDPTCTTSTGTLVSSSGNLVMTAYVTTDDGTTPVEGVTVTFGIVTGGGSIVPTATLPMNLVLLTATTDDNGKAIAVYTGPGGASPGEAVVEAYITGTNNGGGAAGLIHW
jgi:Zn ribbon nucleic-acid-binding protein